jgi:putative heme transporter
VIGARHTSRAPFEQRERRPRRRLITRGFMLAIAALCLYLLAPAIGEVFSAWRRLGQVHPAWMVPAVVCAVASFACLWVVQAVALGTRDWFAVINSQLAANAFNRVTPGGGATGTVLQATMLSTAGIDAARAGTALTAQSLLSTASLVALPVFCIPFVIAGTQIPNGLMSSIWIGIPVFALMVVIGLAVFAFDAPLRWLGCWIAAIRRRLGKHGMDGTELGAHLLRNRDTILREIGPRWELAVGLSVLRWLFEYGVIVATLYGLGTRPDPALTLLAFAAASVLGLLPFTPGGLGFVEAGLTGTLALAGVSAGNALVTTLVYRLLTFWLPIPIGAVAWFMFRRRYPRARSGTGTAVAREGSDATTTSR